MSDFQEKLLVQKDVKLKLYYYRDDNKYDGWSALVWGGGSRRRKINFFEDLGDSSYGRVAEVILTDVLDADKIYFAIGRLDNSNNFLEREYDEDRFVLARDAKQNGNIEAYVIHGKKELQKREKDITFNLHYKRKNRDYDNWDVHTWINGQKVDIKFGDGEYSNWKVAKYQLSKVKPSDRLGFIIRRGGNNWLEKECREKVINLRKYERNGVVDVYMMQNIPKIVFSEPVEVRFHYWRYDSRYKDWNLWVWKKFKPGLERDEPGNSVFFLENDVTYGTRYGGSAGSIANFLLVPDESVDKIGFLIRKGNWKDRDIDLDRFISMDDILRHVRGGVVDVYLTQGDLRIGYAENEMDLLPKIVDATFKAISKENPKVRTIDVELNLKFRRERSNRETDRAFVVPFVLRSETGEEIPISSVQRRGERSEAEDEGRFFEIDLRTENGRFGIEPFDKRYILELAGYESYVVSRRKLYDCPEYEEKLTYNQDDLGVTYSKEVSRFRVWAPEAENMELVLYDKDIDSDPVEVVVLERSKGGTWYAEVEEDLKGMFYTYRVYAGTRVVETVDPYAKSSGINAERGAIIDLADTNPKGWDDVVRPSFSKETDAMITEIHVRNYSIKESSGISKEKRGKFVALVEENTKTSGGEKTCLSHIKDMGYTHVQIMPITKCGSLDEERVVVNKGNWGYDTTHSMIIEGTYSTNPHDPVVRIKEFKKVVQAFHEKGIRVILDVVLNHTYKTEFSNLNILMNKYYYRVRGEAFSDAIECSNEIASERKMVRKYIVDTIKYWVKEFKVDGFRFDVMYILDKETLNEVRAEIDRIDPSILVYGEGWEPKNTTTIDKKLLARRVDATDMPRIGFFSNEAADAIKGSFDGTDRGFANADSRDNAGSKIYRLKRAIVADVYHPQLHNWEDRIRPNQVVNYVGVHDNLTWWDKIIRSVNNSESVKRKKYRLGYSTLFTMQGALVVPEGDEFLRTKGCNHNSYNADDIVNGIEWKRKEEYMEDNDYIKGLIKMRKAHRGLRMDDPDEIRKKVRFMDNMPDKVIGYTITDYANKDIARRIAIVHNGDWQEHTIQLPNRGWSVIVNNRKAGISEIERIKGDRVKVLAHSSVVLTD